PGAAEADDHARPRHLLLLERGPRPLDRHRDGDRRPRPRRRDPAHPHARPHDHRPRGEEHGLPRPREQPAERLRGERAMNAMTSPRAGVTVAELPPATRISLRLADPAAAGLSLPTAVGARSTEGSRTALCLGPDE